MVLGEDVMSLLSTRGRESRSAVVNVPPLRVHSRLVPDLRREVVMRRWSSRPVPHEVRMRKAS
jgi:hypothetical protein